MDLARIAFDSFYDRIKPIIFRATKEDPEVAHSLFVSTCNILHSLGIEGLVLDNSTNKTKVCPISNAAGFIKNAEINPRTLGCLGFDRVVIGTVHADYWTGNPRPRTIRFPETGSMVNWMGLPGEPAEVVAERLRSYGNHDIPLTINIMSTPGKKGDCILKDLEQTVRAFRDIPFVNRFELNISCPNTHEQSGKMDARREYQELLSSMIGVVYPLLLSFQELDLKVSPDSNERVAEDIIQSATNIARITTANTTTSHNPNYVLSSPGKGGASGNAVYDSSLRTQKLFYDLIKKSGKKIGLIACGGINSKSRRDERIANGATEIQLYTPLIFYGPRVLRDLRTS